jgi:beta-1,4-mannosyltransferase
VTGSSFEQAQLNVLMVPDYREGNPYQTLLQKALCTQAVNAKFACGYRRGLPLYRAIKDAKEPIHILHLNWLEAYLRGKNKLTYIIYAFKFLLDLLLVRAIGTKIVWTIHDQLEHESLCPSLEQWIRYQLIRLTNQVILHNQSSLDWLLKTYCLPLEHANVIPHGHYRDVYAPPITAMDARRQLQLPLEGRIYLNLGMLKPYKGIEHLIEVWQTCSATSQDNTLLIAGQPIHSNYKEFLEQQIEQHPNILFRSGFVDDSLISAFFSAADVIVLPYKQILTSGSVLLAMSYGKPIIAPRLGGIPEVLPYADDLLYDPDAPDGLEQSLVLSQGCDLQDLSRRTIACCDGLDWQQIGYQTKQVYESCFP